MHTYTLFGTSLQKDPREDMHQVFMSVMSAKICAGKMPLARACWLLQQHICTTIADTLPQWYRNMLPARSSFSNFVHWTSRSIFSRLVSDPEILSVPTAFKIVPSGIDETKSQKNLNRAQRKLPKAQPKLPRAFVQRTTGPKASLTVPGVCLKGWQKKIAEQDA